MSTLRTEVIATAFLASIVGAMWITYDATLPAPVINMATGYCWMLTVLALICAFGAVLFPQCVPTEPKKRNWFRAARFWVVIAACFAFEWYILGGANAAIWIAGELHRQSKKAAS